MLALGRVGDWWVSVQQRRVCRLIQTIPFFYNPERATVPNFPHLRIQSPAISSRRDCMTMNDPQLFAGRFARPSAGYHLYQAPYRVRFGPTVPFYGASYVC